MYWTRVVGNLPDKIKENIILDSLALVAVVVSAVSSSLGVLILETGLYRFSDRSTEAIM